MGTMSPETNGVLRCFLMGSDSLLIECADILRRSNHDLRGIVSATPRIERWAREAGIRVIDPRSDYAAVLAEAPFDYLFAVTHLEIIPDQVLALPGKLAINFHDGPLPRYAGLNAPAWAPINREPRYGIIWHVMTAGVDAGDLLAQVTFEVAPGETSLSLNTRCFQAAIDSFGPLVDELAGGTVRRTPQDRERRTYFGKRHRPPAAGRIDWGRPAAEIEALVRALDFGDRYPNLLGLAKIAQGGQVAAVHRAEA